MSTAKYQQFDKPKFLKYYYDTPNISKCAKKLKIRRRDAMHELAQDEAFRGDLHDLEMSHADEAKEQLVQASRGLLKLGQNYLPTITVVKAHFTKYQDKMRHQHESMNNKVGQIYLDKLKKVEVIESKPVKGDK